MTQSDKALQNLRDLLSGDPEASETYTVTQIRRAFANHATNDDWGVPSFYDESLIAALRGEYDNE